MATHSSILAWRIPWTEEPGGLYGPWGHRRVEHDRDYTATRGEGRQEWGVAYQAICWWWSNENGPESDSGNGCTVL